MPDQSLAESDAFAQLFNELHDPAFVIDVETGAFLAANRAAAQLLGYTPEDLEELSPTDIHPHELPRLQNFLENVLRNGRWQADDLSCRTRAGEFLPAEVRARAITLDGRTRIVTQIRDLRGERLAEVGQSVRKLVHDLRNALTTAQLLSDRLSNHEDEKVRASSDVIARSLERAVDLCRQTINAGVIEEQHPSRTRFMLADVVEEVIATTVLPSGVGLRVTFDADDTTLLDADFDQIYRALLNLVRNASDAGADEVRIEGQRETGRSLIMVTDDGPGLPGFVRDNLASEVAGKSEGSSGLGLMITAEIATRHGGDLSVQDTGNWGTRFCLTIPDTA